MYKVLNIPREIYQLVDYLNRNGMKTANLFTVERKYASNPLINDIRDWLNFWSPTDFREYKKKKTSKFNLQPFKDLKIEINQRFVCESFYAFQLAIRMSPQKPYYCYWNHRPNHWPVQWKRNASTLNRLINAVK